MHACGFVRVDKCVCVYMMWCAKTTSVKLVVGWVRVLSPCLTARPSQTLKSIWSRSQPCICRPFCILPSSGCPTSLLLPSASHKRPDSPPCWSAHMLRASPVARRACALPNQQQCPAAGSGGAPRPARTALSTRLSTLRPLLRLHEHGGHAGEKMKETCQRARTLHLLTQVGCLVPFCLPASFCALAARRYDIAFLRSPFFIATVCS